MNLPEVKAQWIGGGTSDGGVAYFAQPASMPRLGALLVLHEAFGLNSDILALCDRLARCGYAVLAPDLYWRGPERLARYDERAKAIAMFKSLRDADVLEDATHGLDVLRRCVGDVPTGVVGFRIGGRYALLVAAREQRRVMAAVSYYGPGIDGTKISPLWTINPIQQVRGLAVPLLLFFAGEDATVPKEEVDRIDQRLRAMGAKYTLVYYPGARPGFVFRGRDTYQEREAEDAWARTLEFFALHRQGQMPASHE